MSDLAPAIAAFFQSSVGMPPEQMDAEILRRWPDATDDEVSRAADIAQELLRAEGAEYFVEAAALEAELERRHAVRGAGTFKTIGELAEKVVDEIARDRVEGPHRPEDNQ